MLGDDREVAPRSNKECRAIARKAKEYYGTNRRWPVNIRRVLNSGKIPSLSGEKLMTNKVVDDQALGDKDANTTIVNGTVSGEVCDQLAVGGVADKLEALSLEVFHDRGPHIQPAK